MQAIALTTDMWTSVATGYVGVTGHFIDSTWHMQSLAIDSEASEEWHTAVSIADRLKKVCCASSTKAVATWSRAEVGVSRLL